MYAVFLLNLFLVSFLLQTTLFEHLTVVGVRPDLILLLACLVGLFFGRQKGLLLGGLAGLVQDSLSGSPLGLNALSKALVGFIAGILQRQIGVDHRPLQMLVAALLTAFDGLLTIGLISLYKEGGLPPRPVLQMLALQMVYNGLFAAPYFAVLTRAARRYLPPVGYTDLHATSAGLRNWLQRTSHKFR